MKTCFLWFHKWDKWLPTKITVRDANKNMEKVAEENGQARNCERCGIRQIRQVRT